MSSESSYLEACEKILSRCNKKKIFHHLLKHLWTKVFSITHANICNLCKAADQVASINRFPSI